VPCGTMRLKIKEFADLKQGNMSVNEYLSSFIQLSRYAMDASTWMKRSRTCS
jgi:hypothetical protein